MKLSNKILITSSIVLFNNVIVFSQGTYDWKEHSEAMDEINWGDSLMGWFYLFVIIGIFYLLYNGFKKINRQTINTNNIKKNINSIKKDIYVGEEKHGKKEGKGKMTYANGDTYDGLWKNDKRHGFGIFKGNYGLISEGNWKDGKLYGWGKTSSPSGPIYEGEYGKKENTDEVLKLWNSYSGKWEKCNAYSIGKGKYIFFDFNYLNEYGHSLQVHGDIFEGEKKMVERYQVWSKRFFGKMSYNVSSNLTVSSKGDVYEGEMNGDFKRDGIGKMTYANGSIYEGKWRENKRVEGVT